MFVACGMWCLADVSSVSPSSEQTGELWANLFMFPFKERIRVGKFRTYLSRTRLPTHLTSKTQFRTPNFSDSVGSAAKIQTLTPNATKCPISFPNVAIRTASCLKHSIESKTSTENRL